MWLRNAIVGGGVIWAFLLFAISSSISGCVPLVTGLKEYHKGADGSTTWSFITGVDIGASANGIDTVKNQRGIHPSKEQ